MLAKWTKILPFFAIEILVKRYGERMDLMPGWVSSNPYKALVVSWIDEKYMVKED